MGGMEAHDGIDLKEEIRKRYGAVRRAGDYHLYTAKGRRLLDLYQEAGGAILGWRAGRSKLAFKNLLDRGVTGNLPTEAEGELVRAVQEVLPQYGAVRWYATRERARAACASFLGLWTEMPLIESPLLHPEASVDIGPGGDSPFSAARQVHGIPVWRPWLDDAFYSMSDKIDSAFLENTNDTVETMVLASPLPWAGGCTLAVFARDDATLIPPSDPVSPVLLGALARAWVDLAGALFERTERDWARFDRYLAPFWERRGPYLVPKIRRAKYPDFFGRCLDVGLLVSPDYQVPSIVPVSADPGEFKRLTPGLLA